jgi:hypothetical protein
MNFTRLLPSSRLLPDIFPSVAWKRPESRNHAGREWREDFVYQESSWLVHLNRTQGAIHDCH